MLHFQTVSSHLLDTLQKLMALQQFDAFRLVGGTSLALQIGHRTSVDIDLFTDREFDSRDIQLKLAEIFSIFEVTSQGPNGFSAQIMDKHKKPCKKPGRFICERLEEQSFHTAGRTSKKSRRTTAPQKKE